MNILKMLFITGIATLMLGCALVALVQTFPENPKFLRRSESVLGLNEKQLKDVLGRPQYVQENRCNVNIYLTEDLAPLLIKGDLWNYGNITFNTIAQMEVCVVNGYAVRERRSLAGNEGTKIFMNVQSLTDTEIVEQAYRGELDTYLPE